MTINWPFYVLLAILLLLTLRMNISLKSNYFDSFLYWIILIVMYFMSVLKDFSVGTDTIVYHEIYEWSAAAQYNGRFELGFFYLFKFFNWLGFEFKSVLVIIYTFIFSVIHYSIRKNNKLSAFSLFLFYLIYFIPLNTMLRQAIAISVVFYTLSLKKNIRIKFILILLASLFHYSAIIAVSLLFFEKFKFQSTYILRFILFALIFYIFLSPIVITFLPQTNFFIYFDDKTTGLLSLINLIFGVLLISFYKIYGFGENRNLIGYSIIMYLLVSVLSMKYPVMHRLTYYFLIPSLLFFPRSWLKFKQQNFNPSFIILNLYLIILNVLIFIYRPNWNGFFPYNFFM